MKDRPSSLLSLLNIAGIESRTAGVGSGTKRPEGERQANLSEHAQRRKATQRVSLEIGQPLVSWPYRVPKSAS